MDKFAAIKNKKAKKRLRWAKDVRKRFHRAICHLLRIRSKAKSRIPMTLLLRRLGHDGGRHGIGPLFQEAIHIQLRAIDLVLECGQSGQLPPPQQVLGLDKRQCETFVSILEAAAAKERDRRHPRRLSA